MEKQKTTGKRNIATRLKLFILQLWRSPKEFPIEALMGLAFFLISAFNAETWDEHSELAVSNINSDILWLFFPLLALTYWAHKVNRIAYIVSGLLFLPLMALDLEPFLWTYGFGVSYILALLLLIVDKRRMGNRDFAIHTLHVITQLFFTVVICGMLTLASTAIIASFLYIFDIGFDNDILKHVCELIWFFMAPQVACSLLSVNIIGNYQSSRFLRIMVNFVLSPAIVIYTVILYAYFVKIIFEWQLPHGGVAWMVMGFIAVALMGLLMQQLLEQRHFDWFYKRFSLIAVPPLLLYWTGSLYRIWQYNLTESRFYLLIAGLLMTIFLLMLTSSRIRNFQLMTIIFGAAIAVFTYIPGISAKDIGLNCQTSRMMSMAAEMNLIDHKTGHLLTPEPATDSVSQTNLAELCSAVEYVRYEMGRSEFEKKFGEWTVKTNNYSDNDDERAIEQTVKLKTPVELGEYCVMCLHDDYTLDTDSICIKLTDSKGKTVLKYAVMERLRLQPQLVNTPEKLLIYGNDSLLMVIDKLVLDYDDFYIPYDGYSVFKKKTVK